MAIIRRVDNVGSGGGSFSGDAGDVTFDPTGTDLVATDVQAALEELDTRASNTLQEGPDFLSSYAFFYDDFFSVNVTSTQIGTLGWSSTLIATGDVVAPTSSEANTIGYLRVRGTAVGDVAQLHLDPFLIIGTPEYIFEGRCRLQATNNGTHDIDAGIGVMAGKTTLAPTSGVWFDYDSENAVATNWYLKTRTGSGSVTSTNTTVAADTSWHRFQIVSDGAGNVYGFIDGTQVAHNTTGLPSGVDITTRFAVHKSLGSGTSRSLFVDYAYLKIAATR